MTTEKRDLYENPLPGYEFVWRITRFGGYSVQRVLAGPVRKDGKRKVLDHSRWQYAYNGRWSPPTGTLYAQASLFATEADAWRSAIRQIEGQIESHKKALADYEAKLVAAHIRLAELEKETTP